MLKLSASVWNKISWHLTKFQLIQLIQTIVIFIFSIGCLIEVKFCKISEINKKFTCCAWDEVKSTGLENCCWGGAPTVFAPEPGTGAAEVAETPIGVGACCEETPVDCAVACWPCWAPTTCVWVCWGGCCA